MTTKKILVTYSKASTFTATTLDYVTAIKNFTNYDVKFAHVTHDAEMDFDFNDFDVVFHNYCARLCFDNYISESYAQSMMNFRGLKIAAVQDDYDKTPALHRSLRRLGFHVLLTCIQSDFWPLVYPKSELPGMKIIQGITGYMPERLKDQGALAKPLAERAITVAYRGRDIGARYGRLGFEKFEIGRRMQEECAQRGISHDIAMDEASRIYGDAWYEFLGSARTMLGAESGSNAFDFEGRIDAGIAAFTEEHGRAPNYHEFRHVLDPLEEPFNVGQISPRVFECALMRTPMILFRGRYSDAIKPDVHYIPLEKDFSNVDEVLAKAQNLDLLNGFADRAYDHLVASGNFGYSSLAKMLEETIEEQYPIWVDPRWQEYRARQAFERVPMSITDDASPEEKRRFVLRETPTDWPGTQAEFLAKLQEAAEAGAPTIVHQWIVKHERGPLLTALSKVWRVLPQDFRYKLAAVLRLRVPS